MIRSTYKELTPQAVSDELNQLNDCLIQETALKGTEKDSYSHFTTLMCHEVVLCTVMSCSHVPARISTEDTPACGKEATSAWRSGKV